MGDGSSLSPHLPWPVPARWPMPSAVRVFSAASRMPACFKEGGGLALKKRELSQQNCPM